MSDYNYYQKDNNNLKSEPIMLRTYINDIEFLFKTDHGVFSREYLDYATRLLLENIEIEDNKSLLDVGCGYGPIGIYYAVAKKARVTMIDVNLRALDLTRENCITNKVDATVLESDCLDEVINNKYDYVISNPPIRAGKKVVYKIFEQAKEVLNDGGKFYIVIQKQHGAESAIKKLEELYKRVDVIYKKKGFYIIKSYNE